VSLAFLVKVILSSSQQHKQLPKQTIRSKQDNINTPFTSTNSKHVRKGKRLVISICFVFVAIRVLRFLGRVMA
jgi:hypothetical protein